MSANRSIVNQTTKVSTAIAELRQGLRGNRRGDTGRKGIYHVLEAKNGQEAIETVIRERPDLILLDANMPDMNGLEACRKIRLSFDGPIIMVTVRSSKRDKMNAFGSGADDYVVKPFSTEELLARMQVALKRSGLGQPLPKIETPELNVDFERRRRRIVDVRGNRVHLTPKEFEVLRTLVIQQGKAVTYRKILQVVWGPITAKKSGKFV